MRNLMSAARRAAQGVARHWLVADLRLLRQTTPPRGLNGLRLWALRRVLQLLDRRFEQQFQALLRHAVPMYSTQRSCPLLVALIGTLGPGGAERQLVNTLLGLKSRYVIDIEVIAMYLEEESQRFFLETLENAGIAVSRVNRSSGLEIPGGVSPEQAQGLQHAVRTHLHPDLDHVGAYTSLLLARRPDIVHLWLDDVNTKGGLAAVLAGVPRIVLGMRNVNPSHFVFYQPYMRAAYRSLLHLARVIALNNSEAGALDYARWLGIPPGRIAVLRNGLCVDSAAAAQAAAGAHAYRARWNIPVPAPVLGGVMRLSEEKRPLLWVEVAEAVAARCPDVHFLLVGDGVQGPLVDARINASRFADRFHRVGHERKPYDSLSAMSVLFLSSLYEGSPNVLIEAQAVGVPVVTMPAGGAVEVVDDGRTGWVVHDGSVAAAAERIADLITHPRELTAAAAAAPDWVHARFSLDRMITETAAAYGGLQPLPPEARAAHIGA
jgi:glycosyltransferase involved in cell wall biosynthesis